MIVGQRKGWDLQSCSSETKAKATGRSFRQVWTVHSLGGPGSLWGDRQPPALSPAAPSPRESQPPRAEAALLRPRASPAPLRPLATCWRLQPTGTELWVLWGAGPDERDWESPTASSSQAATHPPGSHQPPDTRQGSVSQSFLPFLRLWPHGRLGPMFQVPACPQSYCEAAAHRDTAGSHFIKKPQCFCFLFICTRQVSRLHPKCWCSVE